MMSRVAPIIPVALMLSACASAPVRESAGADFRPPITHEYVAACMYATRLGLDFYDLNNHLKERFASGASEEYKERLMQAYQRAWERLQAGELLTRPSEKEKPTAEEIAKARAELEILRQKLREGEPTRPFVLESLRLIEEPSGALRRMTEEEYVASLTPSERLAYEKLPPQARKFRDPDPIFIGFLTEEAVDEIVRKPCMDWVAKRIETLPAAARPTVQQWQQYLHRQFARQRAPYCIAKSDESLAPLSPSQPQRWKLVCD